MAQCLYPLLVEDAFIPVTRGVKRYIIFVGKYLAGGRKRFRRAEGSVSDRIKYIHS